MKRRRRLPLRERLAVLTAFESRCVYCCSPSETEDHVIPWALGGEDSWRNLVPSCEECNRRKSDLMLHEWLIRQQMGWIPNEEVPLTGRGYFEWAVEETRERFELIEEVQREIQFEPRRIWFMNRFGDLGTPRSRSEIDFWRGYARRELRVEEERGFSAPWCKELGNHVTL
jgi:hypothetical protein